MTITEDFKNELSELLKKHSIFKDYEGAEILIANYLCNILLAQATLYDEAAKWLNHE